MYVRAKSLQSCLTVWPRGLQPARLFCPRDSPGKSTGVGCHALLQGIFPAQGSNPRSRSPAAAANLLQSCPTLHDPMDCSPPGSSVPGISQARVLEWGAIAFSRSLSSMAQSLFVILAAFTSSLPFLVLGILFALQRLFTFLRQLMYHSILL